MSRKLICINSVGVMALCFFAASGVGSTAATLTVNNLYDAGPGSLRQAIQDAATNDTINIVVSGTISLGTGQLVISKNMTINGPGRTNLAISGSVTSRVFQIESNATVTLTALTIRDGKARNGTNPGEPGAAGGGLYNAGTLTMVGCAILNNVAGNGAHGFDSLGGTNAGPGGAGGDGGGAYNAGVLEMNACTLSDNRAGNGEAGGYARYWPGYADSGGSGGSGGAIYNSGRLTLTVCSLTGDYAGDGGEGGSIRFAGSAGTGGTGGSGGALCSGNMLTVTLCTISGNFAGHAGFGGRDSEGFPTGPGGLAGSGGGIYIWGTANIQSATVAYNQAQTNSVSSLWASYPSNAVGGIHSQGTVYLNNVLIAQNVSPTNSGADVRGTFISQGHNFIGVADDSTGLTNGVNADIAGTSAMPLDPKLALLRNNGGPTPTLALLIGSPAIDRGSSNGMLTDQRGRARPADIPGITNAPGGDGTDIGAFEFQPPILFPPLRTGSNIVLRFTTEFGQAYRVQRTDKLEASLWETIANDIAGSGQVVQVTNSTPGPQFFYRVIGL